MGENESAKKWRRPTCICQFWSWSSKSQEAKMMHDVLQPTEIALRRSSSVAHLYVHLDRGSKAWVNSQDLLPFAWYLLVDFSLAIAIDDATGHTRSGAKKVSDAKSKKSVGSALQNTVGRVSRSRDLFLFGLMRFLNSNGKKRAMPLSDHPHKKEEVFGQITHNVIKYYHDQITHHVLLCRVLQTWTCPPRHAPP